MVRSCIFFVALFLFGCDQHQSDNKLPTSRPVEAPVVTYNRWEANNVLRVFLHNPDEYSILAQEGGELKLYPLWGPEKNKVFASVVESLGASTRLGGYSLSTKLFQDAIEGKPMTATVEAVDPGFFENWQFIVTVHVHSERSVEGAGWTRLHQVGKQTVAVQGQTQVVE